jgi:uncharacterized membrane protein YqjE
MANEIHVAPRPELRDGPGPTGPEPSLGELFKQLAQDSAALVRQEMALAKAEMRDNLRSYTKDVAMVVVGGLLALLGALVLIAFLVVALGDALDNYWLGALIVGVLFVAVGGFLAKKNLNNLKHDDLKPEQTLQTLKEDKQWLQNEIQDARKTRA